MAMFAVLLFACEKDSSLLNEQQESEVIPYSIHPLQEIEVTVRDGALHFESLEDFAFAVRALSHNSPEDVANWNQMNNFDSWYDLKEQIQTKLDLEQLTAIPEEYSSLLYLTNDGTLKSYASSGIFAKVMNSQGVVFVDGYLHHFHKDYHISIGDPSVEKFIEVKQSLVSDEKNLVRVFPTSSSNKDASFFFCPLNTNGTDVWEHEREERIDGERQRLNVSLDKYVYSFASSDPTDNRIFSVIALDVENRRKSGFIWKRTYPNYEFGTLRSGSTGTGIVSANPVEQSLRVNRRIGAVIRNASGTFARLARQDFDVTMNPVGWSFRQIRSGSADVSFLMDDEITNVIIGSEEQFIRPFGDPYSFARGKLSVRWLDRSSTMHVQVGCR